MNASHTYLVALGSNQRHPAIGDPRRIVSLAMDMLDGALGDVIARSPIVDSAPIGPSQRRYANAALVLESPLAPPALLKALNGAEAMLGRQRRGQRWRSRTLDLDIVLWSGGIRATPDLQIPHPQFRTRDFVIGPAAAIAPQWRDPVSGLTLKQLHHRLTRGRPTPR